MSRRQRPPLPEGPYLVVGLARSGSAVARVLSERGATVIGLDAATPAQATLQALEEAGVELRVGAQGTELLERVGAVVKSPGVPRQAPVIARALQLGMPVLGELEVGWRLIENEVVAVTGTNGKTTTVEWIAHVHRVAGLPVAVAGNVGTALSSLVGKVAQEATVVCECSSFQLEDTEAFAPETAVLLNVSADHLDRHKTFDAYVAAKLKVFERQSAQDIAVVPADLRIAIPGHARRVRWNVGEAGAWQVGLRGRHNAKNAMATAAVCLARGIEKDAVREGLRTFAGVKHRLEQVATAEGVAYVNDSKATNIASTIVALDAFSAQTVHLILGGQGKGQDFAPLREPVERACKAVYVIGEDAGKIKAALTTAPVRSVPVGECGDLEHAVELAAAAARPGEVVLLSPACASFDQFADYEARGERFRELVARR